MKWSTSFPADAIVLPPFSFVFPFRLSVCDLQLGHYYLFCLIYKKKKKIKEKEKNVDTIRKLNNKDEKQSPLMPVIQVEETSNNH